MKNNDEEALLLNNASLEDLIKMKIEKEFMEDLKKSKEKPEKQILTEIKNLRHNFRQKHQNHHLSILNIFCIKIKPAQNKQVFQKVAQN